MSQEQRELASTYIVLDRRKKEELQRLLLQDQMVTTAMDGVLSEQPDPSVLQRVLDVACGTGGWCLEAARQYPNMTVVGIDSSLKMIGYAREQAAASQLQERVEFHIMDALRWLAFPSESFDLVNLRFGISFIRLWEWNAVLAELLRVLKPGGVVRVTETSLVHPSSSPALKRFQESCVYGMQQAGYLPDLDAAGMTRKLAPLLQHFGVQEVQAKPYRTRYRSVTPEGEDYREDVLYALQTLKPFLQRWGCVSEDYEAMCQVVRDEMQQTGFHATWDLLTIWGVK